MSITPHFLFSRMINNFLDLRRLGWSQQDLDKWIPLFEGHIERRFIEYVLVYGNHFYNYNVLNRVFPNIKKVMENDN